MNRLIASMLLGVLIFLASGRIALADEYNVGMIVNGQSVTVTVVVDSGVITATTDSPVVEIVNAVPVTREASVAQYIEQMNETSAAYSVAFSEFWNLAGEIVNDADARSVGKLAIYGARVNNLYSVVKSASDDFKRLTPPVGMVDIHGIAIDSVAHADSAVSSLLEWSDAENSDYDRMLSQSMDEVNAAVNGWFPVVQQAKSIVVGLPSTRPAAKPSANPRSNLGSKVPSISELSKTDAVNAIDYATAVGDILDTYRSSSTQMGVIFNQAQREPTIIYDRRWQNNLLSQLSVIDLAVSRVKDLSPPVFFQESHKLLQQTTDHLNLFSAFTRIWLNNWDKGSLGFAADELTAAAETLPATEQSFTSVLKQLNSD